VSGLSPSIWPAEDGGPRRLQVTSTWQGFDLRAGGELAATFRPAMACTMAVWRDPGELYLLTHTMGLDTMATVERVEPVTLETLIASDALPAGPMWPGGLAAHANGDLHVVYGRWAHRLAHDDLRVLAARELPGDRPYNSFVVLDDGVLVTKDFAKDGDAPSTLHVLDPVDLEVLATLNLPERSIARLSADGSTVYVVGDTHLWRIGWDGRSLSLDDTFRACYRTLDGQTYGWDAVLAFGAAWFLDDGEGTERYAGSFTGRGSSPSPLHLVRVDLASGDVALHEVCGEPLGLVANPPLVDEHRRIAVGFDSSNAVLVAWDVRDDGALHERWRRSQAHAAHMLLAPTTGELLTHDHDRERGMDQAVVVDIETGDELGRVDTGSPVQSVLFPAPGEGRDAYTISFAGITRVFSA
jgi:hypothetical protein